MQDNNKEKSRHNKLIVCICIFFAIIIAAVGLAGYKFIQHEKNQNTKIQSLEERIGKLTAEIQDTATERQGTVLCLTA